MRLMLDNFHSFTVSLLYHLFKKNFDICLQLTVTALEPKRQKKSKKGTDYRERESWAEKRKKKKKKEEEEEEEEERRKKKGEEGRRKKKKSLRWTGLDCWRRLQVTEIVGKGLKSNPAETGLPAETGRNRPKWPKQAGTGRDFGRGGT